MVVIEVLLHVGAQQQSVAGPAVGVGMAGIVPPHSALAERVEHLLSGIGVVAAGTGADACERIDIHVVIHIVATAVGTCGGHHILGLLHVHAAVIVVGHIEHI